MGNSDKQTQPLSSNNQGPQASTKTSSNTSGTKRGTPTAKGATQAPRRISNSKLALRREQKRAERARKLAEKRAAERHTSKAGTYKDTDKNDELFTRDRREKPTRASAKHKMKLSSSQAKVRRSIYFGLSAIVILALVFAGYYFIKWRVEIIATNRTIENIQSTSEVEEVADTRGTEAILSGEDEGSVFWTYLKSNLIRVDLTDLLATNPETVGWIQLPGTQIDYPYVQTSDNDFYLNHSFDHTQNEAGWVFLDYRNSAALSRNTNSIIYAHGRLDGTMFGSLHQVLTPEWQNNASNHVVRISSPEEDSLWQIFSVYRIGNTNDYLYTEFSDHDTYDAFLNTIRSRSAYQFDANVTNADRILTLSTCIGTDDRVVVHAKLIKVTHRDLE